MKLPWKRYPKRRGAGILTVLVSSSLLLMLGLTVAGTSFHHLSLSNRLNHAQTAHNLAEAAMGKAIAELMAKYDKYQGANLSGFTQIAGQSSGQQGMLTFDTTEVANLNSNLRTLQLQASVNNFGSDTNLTVNGRTLIGESAYLQAIGVDHGVERKIECVIYLPKYPWAIASAGPIKLAGQSHVASVKDLADITDPSKELPGHLVTNSAVGADALVFEGDQVTITGDAQSTSGGKAEIAGQPSPLQPFVKGEVRLQRSPAPIPEIKITDYDTSTKTGVTTYSNGTGPNQVDGFAYRDGDLNFPTGLHLNGGVLYVKGNINVNGQISGEGAIISTKDINVTAGGQVASNNKVAVLAGDNLNLQGTSTERLTVSGIVYAGKKLSADYTNVYGNTVAPGPDGMNLKDVNMVQYGQASDMDITVGSGGGPPSDPFTALPLPVRAFVGGQPQNFDVGLQVKVTSPTSRFFDPVSQKYKVRVDLQNTSFAGGTSAALGPTGQHLPPGIYDTVATPTGAQPWSQVPAVGSGPATLNLTDVTVYIDGVATPASSLDLNAIKTHAISRINAQLGAAGPLDATGMALVNASVDSQLAPAAIIDLTVFGRSNLRDVALLATQWSTATPGETVKISLNKDDHMSRFISRAERIRIMYWRETQ